MRPIPPILFVHLGLNVIMSSQIVPSFEIFADSRYDFAETIERIRAAAADVNFSIVFELDVEQRAQGKGLSTPPLMIMGVCSVSHAVHMLEAFPDVAALLPCRIFVQQRPHGVVVGTQNVSAMAAHYGFVGAEEVVADVSAALAAILASVS